MSGAKEEDDKDEEKNVDGEDMDTSELGLSASQVNAAVAAAAALKSKEAAGALAPKASEIADAATSTKATKRKEELYKAAEPEELPSNVATEAAKELERYATMPLSEASRIIETKLVAGVREAVIDSEQAPSAKIICATAYLQTTPRPNPMFGDIPGTFEPENSAQLVSTQVPRLRAALGKWGEPFQIPLVDLTWAKGLPAVYEATIPAGVVVMPSGLKWQQLFG